MLSTMISLVIEIAPFTYQLLSRPYSPNEDIWVGNLKMCIILVI